MSAPHVVTTSKLSSISDSDTSREYVERPWEFDAYQVPWEELKKEYGEARILICGRGGAGKSSLVNSLFELKDDGSERKAREGLTGHAVTLKVSRYERTTKFGDKIFVFDSPGFGDIHKTDRDIVEAMQKATDKKIDLLFYCISLNGGCRVEMGDVTAIEIITRTFSAKIWENAVIVLTFANVLEKKCPEKEKYKTIIRNISSDIYQTLSKFMHGTAENIPIEVAGYKETRVLHRDEDWRDRIFISALETVVPEKLPALFETRYKVGDFKSLYPGRDLRPNKGFSPGLTVGEPVLAALLELLRPFKPADESPVKNRISNFIRNNIIHFQQRKLRRNKHATLGPLIDNS